MNSELRHAAVAALVELGRSSDHRDRADAGQGLAALAEVPDAAGPLLELVLDRSDTFVTRVTARALLRRADRAGMAILASAVAVSDPNHADWIHTAIDDVCGIHSDDRDGAARLCEELVRDPDSRVARGARQLLDALAGIEPVLRPCRPGTNDAAHAPTR
ncbi:hypothetical protein ACFWBC_12190 [Streptomyces sp. NPDC059985]|uniref:hypothetical protein n=1 Tax=Streptomyces sp. NPDC059985 TaxID=3347025 RepID=UPI0036C2E5B5